MTSQYSFETGPLSWGQESLIFFNRQSPGTAAWNTRFVLRIRGAVDGGRMRDCFDALIGRHAILRTVYPRNAAEQVVLDTLPSDFESCDASSWSDDAVDKYIESESLPAFDLEKGPVMRVRLLKRSEGIHDLLVCIHHIAIDYLSFSVLVDDLKALYDGSSLTRPKSSYVDFARAQREYISGDAASSSLDYWRNQLQDTLGGTDFPLDRLRPAAPSWSGAVWNFELPKALLEAMSALARREGVTLPAIGLAAFGILLHRYTRKDRVVIGTPGAGRTAAAFERVVGYFINLLPVVVDCSDNPNFRDYVKRITGVVFDALDHQDYPFPLLVDKLGVQRIPNRAPLFDVIFSWDKPYDVRKVAKGGLDIETLSAVQPEASTDLTLILFERRDGVAGWIRYNTDLFQQTTIEHIAEQFLNVLRAAVVSPERPVLGLPVISAHERKRLIEVWAGSQSPFPQKRVEAIFSEQVAATPDAIAVECASVRISYLELERQANSWAAMLRARGCGAGDFVCLAMERSPRLIAAMLGTLKAGAAYVPVDPAWPAERIAFMADDTGAKLLLTDADAKSLTPVDVFESPVGTHNDAAYVMYTSGSTGRPKGVVVPHRGIVRLVRNTDFMRLSKGEVFLQFAAVSFDASTLEIWGPLLNGGRVVLFEGQTASLDDIGDAIARHGVNAMFLTTALFNLIVDRKPECLRPVGQLIFGGEAASPSHVRKAMQVLTDTRIIHAYGPTENTTFTTCGTLEQNGSWVTPPIGRPIANTRVYILDASREPVGIGMPGELWAGGEGVALGYWNREDLTRERFVDDPFRAAGKMYRTGDLARWLPDGNIEFLGRIDNQVKIRGFRIEPGEIEVALAEHEAVAGCAVGVLEAGGEKRLVAWAAPRNGVKLSPGMLRQYLKQRLPEYMVPADVVLMDELPLNANGKIDRKALPNPGDVQATTSAAPRGEIERKIAGVWEKALGRKAGRDDNFFELGGHSLLLIQVHAELNRSLAEELDKELAIVDLFRCPTVRSLATFIVGAEEPEAETEARPERKREREPIAIVAMTGRFPGAPDVETLWQNLRAGTESIRKFTEEELRGAGISEEEFNRTNYVKAGTVLEGAEMFDARFFGLNPREAEITDPQHRLFLECAHEALELGGCDPARYPGRIGVFAGATVSSYWTEKVNRNPEAVERAGYLQTLIGNDKDFVPSRVAYKLNLRGPAINVQTACSTSLVAVHLACESLEAGTCDMALAGGVSIRFPQPAGYLYQQEGIMSPDGHCLPFEERSQGTLAGNGVGVVLLKRLSDALADGDSIEAVILGSAINNDGSEKVGYTAPAVRGQAEVIRAAQIKAGVAPETVTAIEAHGTGTNLGDPIEVAALKEVFGQQGNGGCALSSVKGNLGHMDAAAGVTGLIKAVLQLKHRELAPTVRFEKPNPKLELDGSPFHVTRELERWHQETPLRIGVSSFGIGGTNAHAVLEEAPRREVLARAQRPFQLLVLSAKTAEALEQSSANLTAWLEDHREANLPDVAWTLQTGRTAHRFRRSVICAMADQGAKALGTLDPSRVSTGEVSPGDLSIVFMFPGGGTQYPAMGLGLYETERVFKYEVDRCAELLHAEIGLDIREWMYPSPQRLAEARTQLRRTRLGLPALFVTEYANARLLMSWGIRPESMIGHSLGEYVCACLSGVLRLEDAIRLVAARSRLMDQIPAGGMLVVRAPADEILGRLPGSLAIAAINSPDLCVVSGGSGSLADFEAALNALDIETQRLHIDVASHSPVVDGILEEFGDVVRSFDLHPPQIPYISNLTGTWITAEQATDPGYWTSHLRNTVRFADGIGELLRQPGRIFVEAGPGRTLTSLTLGHPAKDHSHLSVQTLRHPHDEQADDAVSTAAVGQLWLCGATIDWAAFHAGETRRKIALPVYPFEREFFSVVPAAANARQAKRRTQSSFDDYFYAPVWKQMARRKSGSKREPEQWLFFLDDTGVASRAAAQLESRGGHVIRIHRGDGFAVRGNNDYTIDPLKREDYASLVDALAQGGSLPENLAHFLPVTPAGISLPLEEVKERAFYSLLWLAQALGDKAASNRIRLEIVSNGAHSVLAREESWPEKALLAGPCHVIPAEYPNVSCRHIDLPADVQEEDIADLVNALESGDDWTSIALRAGDRWIQSWEPVKVEGRSQLRDRGVYVITGGTGGIAIEIAEALTRDVHARIGLISRTPPSPEVRRRLEGMEELGGQFMLLHADVGDRAAMSAAFASVESRFGAIHGVIHSAGLTGGGLVQLKTREMAEPVLRAKVDGLFTLDALLAGRQPDFFVLCSSLSAVLGGVGHVDYCGANAVLDAWAQSRRNRGDIAVASVNWNTWKGVGMASSVEMPQSLREWKEVVQQTGITAAEGQTAFRRILSSGLSRVAVCTEDLISKVEDHFTFSPPAAAETARPKNTLHQRPNMRVPFVEPRNPTETSIVSIWCDLLGVQEIGIHDNFFLLGGHSLLGTRMIARLHAELDVHVPLRQLFASPTPAGLAEAVESIRQQKEERETAELLRMVEQLDEQEAESALAGGTVAGD